MEDSEISAALKDSFTSSGIKIHNNSKVKSIDKLKTKIKVNVVKLVSHR